jgi:prolipoprotein diacylglyceryltransferase
VPGLMTSIYLVLTGIERFLIEKIRVNNQYHINGYQITQAEIISFIMILLGISGIIYLSRKKYQSTPQV